MQWADGGRACACVRARLRPNDPPAAYRCTLTEHCLRPPCPARSDEGVQASHPDLVANMWVNPDEGATPNGVDNDANGEPCP